MHKIFCRKPTEKHGLRREKWEWEDTSRCIYGRKELMRTGGRWSRPNEGFGISSGMVKGKVVSVFN
jgi:hypothetical protein